jgi:hypothetical protein
LLLLCAVACHRAVVIGSSVECVGDADCAPPATVCSADGRCVPGCSSHPCVAGATCNAATGECEGGSLIGKTCAADADCGAPDLVCKSATKQCTAGCDIDPQVCYGGWICNHATGRCCDPKFPECRAPMPMGCDADTDCAAIAGTICAAGTCVPGCARSGCTAPLACTASGHCGPAGGTCTRDDDCDGASSCRPDGSCAVLPLAGSIPCAGGVAVSATCDQSTSPAAWASCVGAPGPAGCPYCTEGSCFHAGLCATAADCHAGDACVSGLCQAAAPACPSTTPADAVIGGGFGAGHETCVQDRVGSIAELAGGGVLLRLGDAPGLYAEITPLYLAAGVARPTVGMTITVHGTVRWDESHAEWELMPVDWWSK